MSYWTVLGITALLLLHCIGITALYWVSLHCIGYYCTVLGTRVHFTQIRRNMTNKMAGLDQLEIIFWPVWISVCVDVWMCA